MPKFNFSIAMDVRAYGTVEAEAETIDAALEEISHPYFNIGANFNPRGNGADDIDYHNYNDVSVMAYSEADDDEIDIDYTIPTENDSAAGLRTFIAKMASLTTPEDETDGSEDSVSAFLSDIAGDRLFDEYTAFMQLVREARELLGATS